MSSGLAKRREGQRRRRPERQSEGRWPGDRPDNSRRRPVPWRMFFVLLILLLTVMLFVIRAAGSSQCQAQVSISGRLTDEAGQALAGQELRFTFYTSPYKRDVELVTKTGSQGEFHLAGAIAQSAYENYDAYCVEIQARLYVTGYDGDLAYQPGTPQQISESGSYETWGQAGAYQDGSIQLFHSVRLAAANDEGRPEFADLTIQLGSPAEPCLIQLGKDSPAPTTTVLVRHVAWESGEALADPETHTLNFTDPAGLKLYPQSPAGLAPIKVEQEGITMREAERGSPIVEYTVQNRSDWGELGRMNKDQIAVTFYYHPDRDGDGIPDFTVTELFVNGQGDQLPGMDQQTALYNYRDVYQGKAPSVTGYRYRGYLDGLNQEREITSGAPETRVTTDLRYQYIYEKKGGTGGGSGGSGQTEPPEEGSGGEGLDPQPPIDPKPPVVPEPEGPPEPPAKPEPDGSIEAPDEVTPPAADAETEAARAGRSNHNASTPVPPLTDQEREALRNITFVKENHTQEAQPGEEITYYFLGFENGFPYALTEFTIVDEPEPGLDLISLQLPAFALGAGHTYEVAYTTNRNGERVLARGLPADQETTLRAPAFADGEYITKVAIRFGEVPSGFGRDETISITFRIWDDPPADTLHNLGFLYYSDQGEKVAVQSAEEPALLTVKSSRSGNQRDNPEAGDPQTAGLDGHPWQTQTLANRRNLAWSIPMLALGGFGLAAATTKRKKRHHQ